jgi:hypothetical protein
MSLPLAKFIVHCRGSAVTVSTAPAGIPPGPPPSEAPPRRTLPERERERERDDADLDLSLELRRARPVNMIVLV